MKQIEVFFSGPMQVDLREELKIIRQHSLVERNRPDMLWRRLCSVVSTSGSSVNSEAFMERYETELRFDVLPKTHAARTKAIRSVLVDAKVPRRQEQKAEDLSRNYKIVSDLGGPIDATKAMLSQVGKADKQAWVRKFNGVGKKYSNDIWMCICDPDFENAIALDTRVKNFAKSIGFDIKSSNLERELLDFARDCGLSGWELDRLIYNFGSLILRTLKRQHAISDA